MTTIRMRPDLGLLLLRVVTGLTFLLHGYQKVFTYGFAGVGGAFEKMGVPIPMVAGPAIGLLELIGGVALVVGLFSRFFGTLLACDMLGAIMLVHGRNGFFLPRGYEFVLILFAASATIALAGAGELSAYAVVRKRRPPQ